MSDRLRGPAAWLIALAAVGLALLALEQAADLQSRPDEDPFPHRDHQSLFPSCLACHQGIPEGNEEQYYSVTDEQCSRCHDGEELDPVEWTAPGPKPHNLDFTHPSHAAALREAGDEPLSCQGCHGTDSQGPRMAVAAAEAESCLSCHAHEAPAHLSAPSGCTTCHVPLAEASALSRNQIAGFPLPADHEKRGFLLDHGSEARSATETCAVCHARQSCTRCHLNGDRLEPIATLAPDPRAAELAATRGGEWPEPASHGPDWYQSHGDEAARDPASCSNCHARSSCTTCHTGDEPTVNRMPIPAPGEPSGARTARLRPPSHGPDFVRNHGAAAATSLPRCESCHLEQTCAGCHASTGGAEPGVTVGSSTGWPSLGTEGGYHPPNFILRHGAEAFAARTECSECHSTEAFCRSCHEELGMSREGRLGNSSFHDAVPNWLLGHGQAARRNLESCASCHQQTSCLRCHSARTGWRISPHGPGFDPNRVSERSAISCAICHPSLPPGGDGGG